MFALEVLGRYAGPSPRTQQEPCALPWLHAHLHLQLERVEFFWLYNSFLHTHLGHGTDYALIAGIGLCSR